MKKTFVVCITALFLVSILGGCSTFGSKKKNEDAIRTVVKTIEQSLMEKNVDKVLSVVSDKFQYQEYKDKKKLRDIIEQGMMMGYVDNGKLDLEGIAIEIDKSKKSAFVYGIQGSSDAGTASFGLYLDKEETGWKVTGIQINT